MTGQSALLIGATGQVGGHLLKELLASEHFTKVGEYGRRLTQDVTAGKDKLEQKVIDFDKIQPGEWAHSKWDVVFVTLGTTKAAAGSVQAYEKIDRDYVIHAAKAAKADDIKQRIVYISSYGADSKSSLLYARSKGQTEEALATLGYNDVIIFRPGFLKGAQREKTSVGESVLGAITGALSHVTSSLEIDIAVLAKSMRIAGQLGSPELPPAAGATKAGTLTIIGNKGAIGLTKA